MKNVKVKIAKVIEMENIYPRVVNVIVEVPKGSRNKYEYDPLSKRIKLDRVLFSAVHYPADYGYIESTLAEDGDEVDVLVLISEPTFPGCLIEAKPLGLLQMRDEKGIDNKILAVPLKDPLYQHVNDIHDIAPHLLTEIENFFLTYKKLEAKVVATEVWADSKKTMEYLNKTKV
ncbi:MAG: inorganic diphosphatase [Candidatus Humimicrobiaceae bacterium]